MTSSSMTSSMIVSNLQQSNKSRILRLQECAHFHYEVNTVDLPKNFKCIFLNNDLTEADILNKHNVTLNQIGNDSNSNTSNTNSQSNSTNSTSSTSNNTPWFQLQVTSNDKKWIIYRTFENFRYLDKFLHDCIFDRKFSALDDLANINSDLINLTISKNNKKQIESYLKQLKTILNIYMNRFSEIAFVNPINCGPILNWFEIDNKGNRLFAIDDSPINIPGVAAAVVCKRYVAQNLDEISLDVGNMISVIDMPPSDESVWWRGKKELEVGFFPADCVELISKNQNLLNNVGDHLQKSSQNQSVRLKHGKLITLLRSFFNTRPARNQLQSKGILKQRVFACDLGEHLSNSQQDVPKILTICTEFIEKHGIVDGIYRHTGLQSNIQKLRNSFDEERFNEIEQECYINDVHSVSSLLKMYFRELPNPLLTYQLYHKFIKAVNVEDRIIEIHDVVQQLPPPHYRTLAFLMKHLHKLADFSPETNMNTKNLAIVWAPNLLKSKEMDSKDCMQYDMLHSITLQANISEFLIANADTIFNDKFASLVRKPDGSMKNSSLNAKTYRPISVCYNNTGAKLLTLEEAQDKYKQVGPSEIPVYHTVIEIPDLKKKKNKDKDKDKDKEKEKEKDKEKKLSSQAVSGNSHIPANVQIQQQFELLQQQQQQQQKNLMTQSQIQTSQSQNQPIPSSVSSQSISSPIGINQHSSQLNQQTGNNSNSNQASGSSSPALKSILRSLRVGSLKHQPNLTPTSNTSNNTIPQQTVEQNDLTKSQITPTSNISRTASTTTFKPPASSTLGVTTTSSSQAVTPSTTISVQQDYNNCLSQLQSAAAQAINLTHQTNNISSFTGTISTPINSNTLTNQSTQSIILRSSKLNHSQTSIHSNIVQQQQQQQQQQQNNTNQPILSTFKDINNTTNSPVSNIESRKKKDEINNNPVPSKRRTIQPSPSSSSSSSSTQAYHNTLPTSNSSNSIHLSTFNRTPQKPLAPSIKNNNTETNNNLNHHNEFYEENAYDELDQNININNLTNNKENQITQISHTNHKYQPNPAQTTEDEMQQIVAYINQFEKDNIVQKAVSVSPQTEQIDQESIDQKNSQDDEKQMIQSIIEDEPSKLRLSSSSLSSSADSCLNDNTNNPTNNQNLEDENSNSMRIDRRTYIVNKIYDNLGDEDNLEQVGECENDYVNRAENDDDQYEKVILNHHNFHPNNKNKNQIEMEDEEEDYYETEYDNDLLVTNKTDSDNIKIVNRANLNAQKQNQDEEHIYVNVNVNLNLNSVKKEKEIDFPIRESTGFEINDLIDEKLSFDSNNDNDLNHYENAYEFESKFKGNEIEDKNFDSQLVELNNQIKKLLNENEEEVKIEEDVGNEEVKVEEIVISKLESPKKEDIGKIVKRPKSAGIQSSQNHFRKENDQLKRRITVSCSYSDQNKQDGLGNNSPKASFRNKSNSIDASSHSISKSASNDEILNTENPRASFRLKPTSNNQLKKNSENLDNTSSQRKSSANLDELKRIRSIENEQLAEKSEFKVVVPKLRQSISTSNSKDHENEKINIHTDAANLNKKSLSKSLQDNSKFEKNSDSFQTDKIVVIETNSTKDNEESLSVKSKIKLMESKVGSSSNNQGNKLNKYERSSSSSSSCSSSRSPPLSPKVIINEPKTLTTTSSTSKPQAPLVPARTNVNINTIQSPSIKLNTQSSTETDEDNQTEYKNTQTQQPLSNLKEKRRTVKELMSKFEPK